MVFFLSQKKVKTELDAPGSFAQVALVEISMTLNRKRYVGASPSLEVVRFFFFIFLSIYTLTIVNTLEGIFSPFLALFSPSSFALTSSKNGS
jgi:hypothetical protein